MQNKREIHHFLSNECGAYIPPFGNVTIYHLRDLASGKRKLIKGVNVKHLQVPLYDGLKVEEFLRFAQDYPEVFEILPRDKTEIDSLHR